MPSRGGWGYSRRRLVVPTLQIGFVLQKRGCERILRTQIIDYRLGCQGSGFLPTLPCKLKQSVVQAIVQFHTEGGVTHDYTRWIDLEDVRLLLRYKS